MDAQYVQAETTTDSEADAARLARALVEHRLAACAQVLGPITSTYWWQGEVEQAREWVVLLKTRRDRVDGLKEALADLHRYDVPELLVFDVADGNPAYLRWLAAESGGADPAA